MITFIVQGKAVPKARPRVCRYRTYTPQKTKDYEELVAWNFKDQCNQKYEKPLALRVDINIYIKPLKANKDKTQKMLNGEIRPTTRPDIDNIAKSITDALNGIAYDDDSQIVELMIFKKYCRTDYVTVSIMIL